MPIFPQRWTWPILDHLRSCLWFFFLFCLFSTSEVTSLNKSRSSFTVRVTNWACSVYTEISRMWWIVSMNNLCCQINYSNEKSDLAWSLFAQITNSSWKLRAKTKLLNLKTVKETWTDPATEQIHCRRKALPLSHLSQDEISPASKPVVAVTLHLSHLVTPYPQTCWKLIWVIADWVN